MITGVLTSCGRYTLLQQTIESFFRFNTGPMDKLIVMEDGPEIPDEVRNRMSEYPVEWRSTGKRVGQIAAIDYAYSRVRTPYVFHMEDDWEFYRSGFMEKSLIVLESNPKCIQVWIRALADTNKHPILPHVYENMGVRWQRLSFDYHIVGARWKRLFFKNHKHLWHGFSFNPGLRRLSDYVAVDGYGTHTMYDPANPNAAESTLNRLYRSRDYYSAILADDSVGYIRHIGGDHHIGT